MVNIMHNKITWNNWFAYDYVNLYRSDLPFTKDNLPAVYVEYLESTYYNDTSIISGATYYYMIESFHGTSTYYSKLLEFKSTHSSPPINAKIDPQYPESQQLLSSNDISNFNTTEVYSASGLTNEPNYLYKPSFTNGVISGTMERAIKRSDFTIDLYFAHDFYNTDLYGRILTIGRNYQDGSFIICKNGSSNSSTHHDYYDAGYIGNVMNTPVEIGDSMKMIHYTIVRKNGIIYTIVDGILKDVKESDAALLNKELFFGQNSHGGENFSGCFEKIRIFDFDFYDLNIDDISSTDFNKAFMWNSSINAPIFQLEVMQNGSIVCTDQNLQVSGNIANITRSGYSSSLVFPKSNSSAYSDVNLSDGDFTFESYVYFLNGINKNRIIQIGYSSNPNCLALYYDDNKLTLGITTDNSGNFIPIGKVNIDNGNWYNICLMRYRGIIYLYLNNNAIVIDYSRKHLSFNNTFVFIGCAETSGHNWNGAMSNIRIYQSAIYSRLNNISTRWTEKPTSDNYINDYINMYPDINYAVDSAESFAPYDIEFNVSQD